ncbi:MAG: winged helix-turn-helix domain-containing protein [Desulfosudaceae bacterium]
MTASDHKHKHNQQASPARKASGGTTRSPGREDPLVKGKIWIKGRQGTFIGYGRVVLLQRIQQYGSISKAARSMKMSYRHAWELVDSMNCQARAPLVETTTGGKGGGGARLTEAGERAIAAFWQLYENFQLFLERESGRIEL